MITELFQKIGSMDFMPHGHCYQWQPSLIWLHVVSDSMIALAYYSIPIALVYFVKRRQDLAFNWIFTLFAVFILACGTTHLMEIWNIWHASYLTSGAIKMVTALASIPTAILLWMLIPKALKLPSSSALEQANRSLEQEIAERRRAEEEVRALNASLETKVKEATAKLVLESRLKDDFLATLSHELRTPLNAILGWSRLMKIKNSPEDIEKGVAIIEKNTRAQVQLVEDLLDMSRITSGKVRLDARKVELSGVIQSAIASIEPSVSAKQIVIEQSLNQQTGHVLGDTTRLQQIIYNVLSNSIKFTPAGGNIKISLTQTGGMAVIEISDSGIGIEPTYLPFIFDRFRQADSSTTRRYSGLGLGLSIVKQLVELHGGNVKAQSEGTGHGTTILISLPLLNESELGRAEAETSHSIRNGSTLQIPHGLHQLKILIVDDEPDSLEVIRRILECHGAEVITAGGVDEALSHLLGEKIDLLISDIGMPEKDGYDLIRTIRKSGDSRIQSIPSIALTAFARMEDYSRSASAGYNSHLSKPVEPLELIAAIERFRSQAQARAPGVTL
jgi:signal transduction histidine kinase/CheY-like chemotaxis protein